MGKESYKIEKDEFTGDVVCKDCKKLDALGRCTVYDTSGMKFRSIEGHCPVVRRWADWREDKPAVTRTKKRIGQPKQR